MAPPSTRLLKSKSSKSMSPLRSSPARKSAKLIEPDEPEEGSINTLEFKVETLEMYEDIGDKFSVIIAFDGKIIFNEEVTSTYDSGCKCEEEYEEVKEKPQKPSVSGLQSPSSINPLNTSQLSVEEQPKPRRYYYRYSSNNLNKCVALANEFVTVTVISYDIRDSHYPAECFIDILPIIRGDVESINFNKKLEPSKELPITERMSWDNLPWIKIEVSISRQNKMSDESVFFCDFITAEFRLLGVCNAPDLPKGDTYTLATVVPSFAEPFIKTLAFENPRSTTLGRLKEKYSYMSLEASYRRIKESDRNLRKDFKFSNCPSVPDSIRHTLNCLNFDTPTVEWSTLYRTLILKNTKDQLLQRLMYRWPFILSHKSGTHVLEDYKGMGDFQKLTEPGVQKIFAVMLLEPNSMSNLAFECGIYSPFVIDTLAAFCCKHHKHKEPQFKRVYSGVSMETVVSAQDPGDRMVLFFEIELSECLVEKPIPKPIPDDPETLKLRVELLQKLSKHPTKSENLRDWKLIVDRTCTIISTQPLLGQRNFCNLTTILSSTSFWASLKRVIHQTASGFVAETAFIPEYLFNHNHYIELMRNTSIYLTRAAFDALHAKEVKQRLAERDLKAARNAKKHMHYNHAKELLLSCLVHDDTKASLWRELGTLMRSICRSSAITCYMKANDLEPRNNLTLLCLATAIAEEDIGAAEPFFIAILALFPNWAPGLIACNAYLHKREHFAAAGMIVFLMEEHVEQFWGAFTSYNGGEFDEWWSVTPSLCASSIFIRTADLLLRIKAYDLADVCLSKELILYGESPEYLFMLALSRALRGEIANAVRICQMCANIYGRLGSIVNLEAQCKRIKCGFDENLGLEQALHQVYTYPSAFNWSLVAKALRIANRKREAEAVAIHALSLDRTEKTAWKELSFAVTGQADRVNFYMQQAEKCPEHFDCHCETECDSVPPVPSLYK